MPFKLKLKKSRHYSVVSKSLFVISVEILDGTNVECTLSSESTGQDCLDVVCQKLGLNELKFFGLQYVSCASDNGGLCWLELDKPIKRQLDKHARGLSVYLRVMYYVISGVRLITDEVTRYHYFLQLKQDVIEGRLSCTPQQATELASYCMQAEFGNFDAERHTAIYLKDFQLFPKSFTDPLLLESLTEAASRQHAALHNLPQSTAEEYYICACQKLDGYGEEEFHVKDKDGKVAILGIGLTGVSVTCPEKSASKHYGWSDISNVINHKKEFIIESVGGVEKAEFLFGDVESAKNVWRFCVLQHMFFRQYELNAESEPPINRDLPEPPAFQQGSEDPRELASVDPEFHRFSQQQQHHHQQQQQHLQLQQQQPLYPHHLVNSQWEASTQHLSQRAQSTSCLDLHTAAPSAGGAAADNSNRENLRNLLPSYRPAPDYETAVQQKYRNLHAMPDPQMYGSQPEIGQRYHAQPSGAAQTAPSPQATATAAYGGHHVGVVHLYKQPPPYPSNRIGSNSTPDLASMGVAHQQPATNLYLNNLLVSGSSPNLVYETSSVFRQRPALIVENPNITKHIKKVYDEHGNIIYCMPANMKQILQSNHQQQQQQQQQAGFAMQQQQQLQEPIYENIPRVRTQSIHSAPDISQVVNHSLVNQLQRQLQKANLNAEESPEGAVYANLAKPSGNAEETNHAPLYRTFNNVVSKESFSGSNLTMSSDGMNTTTATTATTTTLDGKSETNNNISNLSSSTTSSSTGSKTKKKRWGILMGKGGSKSGEEKAKSATLRPDKKKDDKNQAVKHRWSTGQQPKFNPLPPSIPKEMMCQLLENKLADSQLFFEFDKIPKKKENADFTTALLPDNATFNRFRDVLPYEDNRLRLTPSKGNKYGYINASHITATVGSKQRFYIAAQGPTRATLPYFWQCIWEAEVYLMIQLTDHKEDMSYLPDADERCINVGKDYQVWWEFSQKTGHCVTSKIRLCQVMSRQYRTMWHLHYTDWGDQGCPNSVAHFLGFLEEMQGVYQHSMSEIPPGHNKNPPIFVHCTAGVGRTGLTIISHLLLYTIDHNQEVCIPGVVALLRQQRPQMIQTIAQYRFVYSLLIHYLKQTRLI